MASFGCGDIDGTNFYKFFGRFEEIGLLYLVSVLRWLCEFGLDVPLGIDVKKYKTQLVSGIKVIYNFTKILED